MKIVSGIQSILLTVIGFMSLFMTFSIVFDLFGIREREGNYVMFVVIANMICGFLYLATVVNNWKKHYKTSLYLLILALVILIATFICFKFHIDGGGVYEVRTVKAMTFRTVFTFVMALIGYFSFKNQKVN